MPQVMATSNRQEGAAATTTTRIPWVTRAGKITPTRDARCELHTVIHLLLSNPRGEALTSSHFPAEATEAQKGHVSYKGHQSGGTGPDPRLSGSRGPGSSTTDVTLPNSTKYMASLCFGGRVCFGVGRVYVSIFVLIHQGEKS